MPRAAQLRSNSLHSAVTRVTGSAKKDFAVNVINASETLSIEVVCTLLDWTDITHHFDVAAFSPIRFIGPVTVITADPIGQVDVVQCKAGGRAAWLDLAQ
jgi:hypothetical protein